MLSSLKIVSILLLTIWFLDVFTFTGLPTLCQSISRIAPSPTLPPKQHNLPPPHTHTQPYALPRHPSHSLICSLLLVSRFTSGFIFTSLPKQSLCSAVSCTDNHSLISSTFNPRVWAGPVFIRRRQTSNESTVSVEPCVITERRAPSAVKLGLESD